MVKYPDDKQIIEQNRERAVRLITNRASIEPVSLELLQSPYIGTIDEKFVWEVIFSEQIRLLEQKSEKFILKSRRLLTLEMEIPGYRILNALNKPGQKSYGAEYLDDFFLFDFIDGVESKKLERLLKDKEFYLSYTKKFGAACAMAYTLGFTIQYSPISIVNQQQLPSDVRWVDLTTSFNYPPPNLEVGGMVSHLNDIIRKGETQPHAPEILQQAKKEFYTSFCQEYQRLQNLYTNNLNILSHACDNAIHLPRESKEREKFFERLNPDKTNIGAIVEELKQYESRRLRQIISV